MVWASKVDFLNPNNQSLADLCRNCGTNASVFPTTPPPAPVYNTSGVSAVPDVVIDYRVYYAKAIEQCVAEGHPQAACEDGTAGSWHHITPNSPTVNLWGGYVEGIIYIEAGMTMELYNNVRINGTIIHEGYVPVGSLSTLVGSIRLNSGATLTMDSYVKTDINHDGVQEEPFAPGLAIIGPEYLWLPKNTCLGNCTIDPANPGIKGFVMGGYRIGSDGYSYSAAISTTGLIAGGVMGVWTTSGFGTDDDANCMGPCNPELWAKHFHLAPLTLGGGSHVVFQPLTAPIPGSPGQAGAKPVLLDWTD